VARCATKPRPIERDLPRVLLLVFFNSKARAYLLVSCFLRLARRARAVKSGFIEQPKDPGLLKSAADSNQHRKIFEIERAARHFFLITPVDLYVYFLYNLPACGLWRETLAGVLNRI